MFRSAMADSPLRSSGTGHPVHRALVDVELGDEPVEHVGRHRVLDLEPDGRLEPAPDQLALHRLQQVLGDVLVHLEVPDPGDAERVLLDNLHPPNRSVRCAAMTSSIGTNRFCDSARNLGSSGGTLTRANTVACRLPGSAIMTARLSDRPEMNGNGWAGSTTSGVSTG
jgi:hypothetical protein